MTLCEDGHDEVCYEGRQCPACDLKETALALEKETENLAGTIDELKNEVETLKQQLSENT